MSKIGTRINIERVKFLVLKSHAYHVIMQQLLPFAFLELFPSVSHEAIAGV